MTGFILPKGGLELAAGDFKLAEANLKSVRHSLGDWTG